MPDKEFISETKVLLVHLMLVAEELVQCIENLCEMIGLFSQELLTHCTRIVLNEMIGAVCTSSYRFERIRQLFFIAEKFHMVGWERNIY